MGDEAAAAKSDVPVSRAWIYAGLLLAMIGDELGITLDHRPIEKAAVAKLLQDDPTYGPSALESFQFLGRATDHVIKKHGLRQFLDVGSGLPIKGSVVDRVKRASPADGRVVCVDYDPEVQNYARALPLGDNVAFIPGDIRQPADLLARVDDTGLIDWRKPVCIATVSLYHFFPGDVGPLVRPLIERMAPGSAWISCAGCTEGYEAAQRERAAEAYPANVYPRTPEEIERTFSGLRIAEPGIVSVEDWPEPRGETRRISYSFGGVGYKE